MDIERTMQFILETQAKTEATLQEVAARQKAAEKRMDRAEARMDRAEARMDRAEARMDRFEARHDKDMKEIREILKLGLKRLGELSAAQKRTEKSLAAFIESMNKGTNGRSHPGRGA